MTGSLPGAGYMLGDANALQAVKDGVAKKGW